MRLRSECLDWTTSAKIEVRERISECADIPHTAVFIALVAGTCMHSRILRDKWDASPCDSEKFAAHLTLRK
jgi:hypothetical protein